MWNLVFLLIASAIAMAVFYGMRRFAADQHSAVAPGTWATRAAPPVARAPMAARAPKAVHTLAPLPWDEPVQQSPTLSGDALRERMLDRYIAARFPGLVASAADLERIDDVIRAARLCFEEEKYDQAYELLQMAIARSPGNEPLRLAQIEIAFLQRNKERFVALATEFRAALPQSRNWSEVARLGRAVVPDDPQFGAGTGSRPHEHYGPWPDLPNWIQASWDLTPEVLAADFRRAMLRGPARQPASAERQRLATGG